jgi:hypoxanthine phosphoribosyltransferase
MTESSPVPALEVLIDEAEVLRRVDAVAEAMLGRVDAETVAVCLLTGGLWFCADLTRALSRRGVHLRFDALWLASYGDSETSRGRVEVRAPLQRSVEGRKVLIVDDVFDTGLSLAEAARIVREAGAAEVMTAVFARKPWPSPRAQEPDFVAWEAPDRYLVGYGLDSAGTLRSLPGICAVV